MSEDVFDFNKSFTKKQVDEEVKFLPENVKALAVKALEYEKNGDLINAHSTCNEILAINSGKEVNIVKVLLSRVYYEMFLDDIEGENNKITEDMNNYFEFIDTLTMNEVMQEYIVDTMAKLCDRLECEWFRPFYVIFIDTVEKKKYLTLEKFKNTILSAHLSAESALFYNDLKVTRVTKAFIKAAYNCEFTMLEEESEQLKASMTLDMLTNVYYMCSYYEGHTDEFDYLKEKYPYSYKLIEKDIDTIKEDAVKVKEETVTRLMKYVSNGIAKPQLIIAMDKAYENIMKDNDKAFSAQKVNNTYKRSYEKVGRNDLCPCGSGLKYKQCCGKNI